MGTRRRRTRMVMRSSRKGRGDHCRETSIRNALHSCCSHHSTRKGRTHQLFLNLFRSVRPSHSVDDLRTYREFEQPAEITATNRGKRYTYGTGFLRVATSASSIEWEVDLEGIYHAPGVHVPLLLPGEAGRPVGVTSA